jgi:hypothetical protein
MRQEEQSNARHFAPEVKKTRQATEWAETMINKSLGVPNSDNTQGNPN